ncbi:Uncharacterized protein ABJ99_4634 [Pseudomonas syringae pv. cilantro]|uniref:Lysine--tRNA ligase n=1 Tax=Pseudomonas syringae pv. cilantro TaxID=81035 RepID=A0A0N0XAC2_PSESX|nr:hypothetical protein [Pseudomonas syringae]KPC32328.1 Uncharacterized protein ABJ99_4634 [Pseudomonas syringae pv. cilantro]KPW81628.1 Uncharacterized protein ALO76_01741 [Pseudomonas syringae pv. coriandricola]
MLDGHCKLQWKADWAMRLIHRNTAFEMHGEDLTDSAHTVRDICKVLGVQPPLLMKYGLFTDITGHKISKSKGNGFSLDQVNRYMPEEALQHFMFNNPNRTSRFYPHVSVKAYDNYIADHTLLDRAQPNNPIDFFHRAPTHYRRLATYQKMLNIFTACHPSDIDTAYYYLLKHEHTRHDIINDNAFATVVQKAFTYYQEMIAPEYRPFLLDRYAAHFLHSISAQLRFFDSKHKQINHLQLKHIFESVETQNIGAPYRTLYACLFGEEHGPRIVEYINLLGTQAFCKRLDSNIQQAIHDREYGAMKNNEHASQEAFQDSDTANNPAKIETSNQVNQELKAINFEEIKVRAEAFAKHLRANSESIAESLSGFECYNVAIDEIARCIEFLDNIEFNRSFLNAVSTALLVIFHLINQSTRRPASV